MCRSMSPTRRWATSWANSPLRAPSRATPLTRKSRSKESTMPETHAILRGVRLSVDKGRLVADLIRGKKVDQALNILNFTQKKAAGIIRKVLESAIANAEHNDRADIAELKAKTIHVEQGTTLNRSAAPAKGRDHRIARPTCHVYVTVGTEGARTMGQKTHPSGFPLAVSRNWASGWC